MVSVAPASPKISVVTAVRNGRDLFAATVASIAVQDYTPMEYIVIDGGSTDGTLDVIHANTDHIDAWTTEPDQGIADAFNKGIARASGEYLLFLNADDRLAAPDALTRMVRAIEFEGRPELAYGDCRVLARESRQERYVASIAFQPLAFRRGATLPHPSLFMHRSYFERFGVYDTSFRIAMDYEILLRGALSVQVLHVPTIVTEVSDGGVSTRNGALVVSEIVRAMRLHGIVKPGIQEWRTLAYFQARRLARGALSWCGLYDRFSRWRDSRPGTQ